MAPTSGHSHGIVFLVDGQLAQGSAGSVVAALTRFGNTAALRGPLCSWQLGLGCIKLKPGEAVKLLMLQKPQRVSVKEWHAQVAKLNTTSAALHALIQWMIQEHRRGVIHVISCDFQPGCAPLLQAVQQAAEAHIHISFTAMTTPSDEILEEAQRLRNMTSFESELASFENVMVDSVAPDPLALDLMVARWWLQLDQLLPSMAPGQGHQLRRVTLKLPAPATGTTTKEPTTTRPDLPAEDPLPGMVMMYISCTVGSQFQYWTPEDLPCFVPPSSTRPQAKVLNSSTAEIAKSVPVEAPLRNQLVEVILHVERTAQADALDPALFYGMPFILQPAPCLLDSISDVMPTQACSGADTHVTQVFCALCKVLEQQSRVLLAMGCFSLEDTGHAVPCTIKHLYCLTPCSSPPCMLLRRVACWEQLMPMKSVDLGVGSLADESAMQQAEEIVAMLGQASGQGGSGLERLLSTGCHADIAQLVRALRSK